MWRPLALLSGLTVERYKDRAQRTRTLLDHREVCRRRTCVHCEYQSTLQGVCPQTGVRYWVARPSDSAGRVGVLEQQHCFSLAEGGPAAAVAAQLPRLAVECFEERQTQVPLWSRQTEEPAAEAWAEALTMAFVTCDQQLPDTELCSAVLSVITRSGIYIASCGTSRAVLGSAALDGVTVFCDEVMTEYKHQLRSIDSAVAEAAALEEAQASQAASAKKEMEQVAEEIKTLLEEERETTTKLGNIQEERKKAAALLDGKRKELLEAERMLTMLEVMGKNKRKVQELEEQREKAEQMVKESEQKKKETIQATKKAIAEVAAAKGKGKGKAKAKAKASSAVPKKRAANPDEADTVPTAMAEDIE